jgi:hypothetical protein
MMIHRRSAQAADSPNLTWCAADSAREVALHSVGGKRQPPQEQRAATLYCVSRHDLDGTRRLQRVL